MPKKYTYISALSIICLFFSLGAGPAPAAEEPIPYQEPQPREDLEIRTDNSRTIMGRDGRGDGQGDLIWVVPPAERHNEQQNVPIIIMPEIYPQWDGQWNGPQNGSGGRPGQDGRPPKR